MKVFFANNTERIHAGSQACMKSLLNTLKDYEITGFHNVGELCLTGVQETAFVGSDLLFVNGEGTMHATPRANFLMELIEKAQGLGKKTWLVNSVWQNPRGYYSKVLRNLDYFSVREVLSQRNAFASGVFPEILLDCCLGAWQGGKQVTDFKGKVVKGRTLWGKLPLDLPEISVWDTEFADLVETLKTASLYITGQHHGVYAAGLAGIPFVPISSNTHKIEGLIKTSGIDMKVYNRKEQIPTSIPKGIDFNKFHNFLLGADYFGKAKKHLP